MALDPGWAGVLGAAVGSLGTLAATGLAHYLQNKRSVTLADKRRKRLKALLSGKKYTWRSMETLSAAIGADENTTAELLIEINARASNINHRSWALVSRAPWPDDMQPDR